MNYRIALALTASTLLLSGCTATGSEGGSESVAPTSADVNFCVEADTQMGKFVSVALTGENSDATWMSMNDLFLGEGVMTGIENQDIKNAIVFFGAVTLSSPVGNEAVIGTETADLMMACEVVGAPMSKTQAALDAAK